MLLLLDNCASYEISRFVEYVVSMISSALAPEHGREAQTLRHLIFIELLIRTLGLADYELAHLPFCVSIQIE